MAYVPKIIVSTQQSLWKIVLQEYIWIICKWPGTLVHLGANLHSKVLNAASGRHADVMGSEMCFIYWCHVSTAIYRSLFFFFLCYRWYLLLLPLNRMTTFVGSMGSILPELRINGHIKLVSMTKSSINVSSVTIPSNMPRDYKDI